MIFEAGLADKVMAGEKTVTRRLCSENPRSPWYAGRCAMAPGKVVKVNPGRGVANIGQVRIVGVEKQRLGDVFPTDPAGASVGLEDADREAVLEGFVDAADFVAAFRRINGSWNPDAVVWRVAFVVAP